MYISLSLYIYIYRYLSLSLYIANLRTKILDCTGFGPSIILILRGGSLMPIGNFLESLSQAILAGIILGGRSGVDSSFIVIYVYRHICLSIYLSLSLSIMYIYIYVYIHMWRGWAGRPAGSPEVQAACRSAGPSVRPRFYFRNHSFTLSVSYFFSAFSYYTLFSFVNQGFV